jgi:hypothetical protein
MLTLSTHSFYRQNQLKQKTGITYEFFLPPNDFAEEGEMDVIVLMLLHHRHYNNDCQYPPLRRKHHFTDMYPRI